MRQKVKEGAIEDKKLRPWLNLRLRPFAWLEPRLLLGLDSRGIGRGVLGGTHRVFLEAPREKP